MTCHDEVAASICIKNNHSIHFRFFPEEFDSSHIAYKVKRPYISKELKKPYRSRKESINLAWNIAAGINVNRPQDKCKKDENTMLGTVMSSGERGGIFVYQWEGGDRLVWQIVNDVLMLSRGDLYWLKYYPFIKHIDMSARIIYFQECISEQISERNQRCMFLHTRPHFGHLLRDSIIGEALVFSLAHQENQDSFEPATFTHPHLKDKYLDKQLKYILKKDPYKDIFKNSVPFEVDNIEQGNGVILRGQFYFAKAKEALYGLLPYHQMHTERNSDYVAHPIVHLGIENSPHKRIANQDELRLFMKKREIPSINPDLSPEERFELLSGAEIVIAEPSSSFYNYVLNCSRQTRCIVLLPRSFKKELTTRDAGDWSLLMELLLDGLVIPFYSCETIELEEGSNKTRVIDISLKYDFNALGMLIDDLHKI